MGHRDGSISWNLQKRSCLRHGRKRGRMLKAVYELHTLAMTHAHLYMYTHTCACTHTHATWNMNSVHDAHYFRYPCIVLKWLYFYLGVCVYVTRVCTHMPMCECTYSERPRENTGSFGTGVTGSWCCLCCTENQIQVLCKGRYSSPLSHHSRPSECSLLLNLCTFSISTKWVQLYL